MKEGPLVRGPLRFTTADAAIRDADGRPLAWVEALCDAVWERQIGEYFAAAWTMRNALAEILAIAEAGSCRDSAFGRVQDLAEAALASAKTRPPA